ncbi:MAG: class I mannose-6-phosphate isomerase, partial [Chloroflexi bacterium]|nr:class I mannose-6-phosphate isomerase [Chloroflexota bacterium]
MDTLNASTRLLAPRLVGRVWGGDRLRALAPDAAPSGPIGEAWFGDADEQPGGVLVKLLDVQDRLSVQVHPD